MLYGLSHCSGLWALALAYSYDQANVLVHKFI